jgi:hypothetical protein
MTRSNFFYTRLIAVCLALIFGARASAAEPQSGIHGPINRSQVVRVEGCRARKRTCRKRPGRTAAVRNLAGRPNLSEAQPRQSADLDQLLLDQNNPSSPNYHRWLTPEEYGQRFGVNAGDITAITNWLKSEGMTDIRIGRGRNSVASAPSAIARWVLPTPGAPET